MRPRATLSYCVLTCVLVVFLSPCLRYISRQNNTAFEICSCPTNNNSECNKLNDAQNDQDETKKQNRQWRWRRKPQTAYDVSVNDNDKRRTQKENNSIRKAIKGKLRAGKQQRTNIKRTEEKNQMEPKKYNHDDDDAEESDSNNDRSYCCPEARFQMSEVKDSRPREARPKNLVCIYIYIYIYIHVAGLPDTTETLHLKNQAWELYFL